MYPSDSDAYRTPCDSTRHRSRLLEENVRATCPVLRRTTFVEREAGGLWRLMHRPCRYARKVRELLSNRQSRVGLRPSKRITESLGESHWKLDIDHNPKASQESGTIYWSLNSNPNRDPDAGLGYLLQEVRVCRSVSDLSLHPKCRRLINHQRGHVSMRVMFAARGYTEPWFEFGAD